MQTATETNVKPQKRMGRPPTGRKYTVQVPIDPDDVDVLRAYAENNEVTVAETIRRLIKGTITWSDVQKG